MVKIKKRGVGVSDLESYFREEEREKNIYKEN